MKDDDLIEQLKILQKKEEDQQEKIRELSKPQLEEREEELFEPIQFFVKCDRPKPKLVIPKGYVLYSVIPSEKDWLTYIFVPGTKQEIQGSI